MEDILDIHRSNESDPDLKPSMEEIANGNFQFDLGKCFEIGWSTFTKDVWGFIGYAFVAGLITIFAIVVLEITLLPLLAGFYCAAAALNSGGEKDFGKYFDGFKSFGQMILLYLIWIVVFVVLVLAVAGSAFGSAFAEYFTTIQTGGNPEEILERLQYLQGANWSVNLTSYTLQIVVGAFAMFILPLVAVSKVNAFTAIKYSFKVSLKIFFPLLLISFLTFIMMTFSVYLCILPIFFAYPLAYMFQYGAFHQIFGTQDRSMER